MSNVRRLVFAAAAVLLPAFLISSAFTLTRSVKSAESSLAEMTADTAFVQAGCAGQSLPSLNYISSKNGFLDATLELKMSTNLVAGRTIETNTYNGRIPGPVWRVKPGDTLRINLVNNSRLPGQPPPTQSGQCLPCSVSGAPDRLHGNHLSAKTADGKPMMDPAMTLPSNLHTHGLQVSPICPADDPYLLIKPGECFNYTIKIPENHPTGFYWYHPHNHGTTSRQGWGGMAGAILVENRPELPLAETDKMMVLQELWVDNQGHVPAGVVIPVAGPGSDPNRVQFSTIPAVPTNVYFTVNGAYQPAVELGRGEWQRWRILNAAPHRFFRLQLRSPKGLPLPMFQASQDGLEFPALRQVKEILVAPGNRIEVYIAAAEVGCGKLMALAYDQGHPGGDLPEVTLANVVFSAQGGKGNAGNPPLSLVSVRQYVPPLAPLPPPVSQMNKRTIEFSGNIVPAPVQFFLNGKEFDPTRIDQTVTVGRWEEWTLVNKDVFQHPFHIHVNPFQVTSINGQPWTGPLWWDTFALPPKATVKLLMWFRPDIVGKTVYHCHILPHEDNGMMSAFVLQK